MIRYLGLRSDCGVAPWRLGDRDGSPAFELTNNTRMAIVEIQIAPVGTGRWGRDLLGEDILRPAQSILVDIDAGKGYCRFDIKTIFDDGTGSIRRDIDVCAVERFAVSYR